MTRDELAARIRAERQAAGLTVATAARAAGVHRNTWVHWEAARIRPSGPTIPRIAAALDIPVGRLYNPDVAAEIILTADTREAIRQGHTDTVLERLRPLLAQHAATTAAPALRGAGLRPSRNDVEQRLLARRRAGVRLAELALRATEAEIEARRDADAIR